MRRSRIDTHFRMDGAPVRRCQPRGKIGVVKSDAPKTWYSVRFIFVHTPADPSQPTTYQERITVWHAHSVDDAFKRAEIEAKAYVQTLDPLRWALHEVALEQSYLHVGELGDGAEVFSLVRDSTLKPEQYISMYTDGGSPRTIEE